MTDTLREPRELVDRLTIETPFPLSPATIFVAVGGSHACGTAREGSDLDVRAVAIPPSAFTIGLRNFDAIATPEGAPTDEHVYSLRRFVHLAAGASVPILELLFAPEDCIAEQHALFFDHVVRARDFFLTRRLYASVAGYAFSTAQRAFQGKAHKGREHLLESFGYDTKAVMHAVRLWRMGATALREGMLEVRRPDAVELLQIRDGAIGHADVAVFEGRELVGGFLARERDAFETAYRETTLPEAPDEDRLSQLLVDAHRDFYGWR
jgi:hypothetical protein